MDPKPINDYICFPHHLSDGGGFVYVVLLFEDFHCVGVGVWVQVSVPVCVCDSGLL